MQHFMALTIFFISFTYSLERCNKDINTIVKHHKFLVDLRKEEQMVKNCGRLSAAKKNLKDSLKFLRSFFPDSPFHDYQARYTTLYNLLQIRQDKLSCSEKKTGLIFPGTRRIKSKAVDKLWPKWVHHMSLKNKES